MRWVTEWQIPSLFIYYNERLDELMIYDPPLQLLNDDCISTYIYQNKFFGFDDFMKTQGWEYIGVFN